MAELEELLISVNSELGDLGSIDKAIEALEGLKTFSNDAKKGADSLEKMGNALSQFNSFGKSKTNTSKIAGDISKLENSLESLSKFTSDASKSIKQLSSLGKALGSFTNVGKNLAGINGVTKGIKEMVGVLNKLSQVEKDSSTGIKGLRDLGKALHSFNGLDENVKYLNEVSLGLINLSKASDMLSKHTKADFEYLTTLGSSLKAFSVNMGGTTRIWSTIGDVTNGITGLITSLKDTKDVNVGHIGAIADELKKFNDPAITANSNRLTGTLRELGGTLRELGAYSGNVSSTMDNVINGFQKADQGFYNIRTSVEAVALDFKDALKPVEESNLFETLEKFKHLNDSYKNVGGLGQGLGVLISALDNLGRRDLNTHGITQILEYFNKLAKESYVDEAVRQMEKVGNLAQPIASLVNALKYTDFNDKNNVLTVLGTQINQFYQMLPDNFDKLSYVMYGLRDVIELAKDLSASIPKDNVITQLGASLASFKEIDNGKSLSSLLAGIKSIAEWLSPTLREGTTEAKSQLSVYERAIDSLKDKIVSLNNERTALINERDIAGGTDDTYDKQIAKVEAGIKTYESLLRQQEEKKKELEASFNANNIDTTPIERIAASLGKFSDVGKNLNDFKTMTNSLKGLKDINVNNLNGVELVLEGLFETLNQIPDGKVGALKDLSSVTRALNRLQDIEPSQLDLIADALSRIFNALGSIQGSNNKITIKLDSSGVANFEKVVEKTDESYSKFARNLNEAIDNVDVSGIFNMEAPLKSLQQQLNEAKRMLHSTIKQIEQERQKIDKNSAIGINSKVAEGQRVKYEQLRAQKYQLLEIIQDLNVAIENAPRFETDKEGYQYIHNLKEELKGLQDFMKRFNRGGMADGTTNLGRGFQDVQDRIVMLEDEIQKAESDLEQMDSTVEGLTYRTQEFVNQMSRLADESERASQEMRNGIGEGFGKFSSMLKGSKSPVVGAVGNLTEMYGKAVQGGVAKLGDTQLASLSKLSATLGTLATAIAQVAAVIAVVIAAFKAWWALMNKIRQALVDFVQKAIQFARSMLTHVVGAFNAVAGAVSKVVSAVKSGAEMLGTALRKVGEFGQNIINIFRRVGQAVPVAMKGIKAVLSTVTPKFVKTLASTNFNISKLIKNTHLLKNAIKQVTRYFSMLTRMLMRKSITAFLNQIKESFENLVLFEKNSGDVLLNLNTNVSKMFSEMGRAANQWIAAFEPLINAITPAVVNFFEAVSVMGENVAKFMAILTGQPYYLRAKKFYKDYGESVDETKKKVKNLTNSLDELNVLNDKSSSDDDDEDWKNKWEKVDVDGSFDGIKINVKDILEQIKDWLRNIDWDAIKSKVREVIHRIMEIVNEVLKDLEFWGLLGDTLAQIFNTLMEAWNQFITDFDPVATEKALSELIVHILDGIDWDLIHKNIELTAQKFAQFWNEVFADEKLWSSITKTITNFLNEIVHYFDTWAWTFDFEGFAKRITSSLTDILTGFDYEQLRHAVEGWITGVVDFINKIVSDKKFWKTLGDSIAKIINSTIIEAFSDLAKIDFTEAVDSLKIAIENALTGIKWDKFLESMKKWGENFADIVNGLFGDEGFLTTITTSFAKFANGFIALLDKFITDLKPYDIGKAIMTALGNGLSTIDWDKAFALPAKAINALSDAIRGLLDGLPEDFNLGTWLTEHLKITMEEIKWDEIRKNFDDLSKKINEWLNGILKDEEFWTNAGETTGYVLDIGINFLFNLVNFKGEDLGTAIANYVNGLISRVNIGDVIRKTVDVAINLIVALDVALRGIDWETIGNQITQGIIDAINKVYENRGLIVQTIKDAFAVFNKFIYKLVNRMIADGSFRKLGETAGEIILALIEGVASFFDMNADGIITGMKQLADSLAAFLTKNEKRIVNALNTIIDGLTDIISAFLDEKSALYSKFMDIVKQLHLADLIGVILKAIIVGICETLEANMTIWQSLTGDIERLVQDLWDALSPLFDIILDKLKELIVEKLAEKITKKFNNFSIIDLMTGGILNINGTGGALKRLIKQIENILGGGTTTIKDDPTPTSSTGGGLLDGLFDKFNKFKDGWDSFWNKNKNKTVDVTMDENFDDNVANVTIGTLTNPNLDVDSLSGKTINVEDILSETITTIDIFAEKLHIGEIVSDAKTNDRKADNLYGDNKIGAQGGLLTKDNEVILNGDDFLAKLEKLFNDTLRKFAELLDDYFKQLDLMLSEKIDDTEKMLDNFIKNFKKTIEKLDWDKFGKKFADGFYEYLFVDKLIEMKNAIKKIFDGVGAFKIESDGEGGILSLEKIITDLIEANKITTPELHVESLTFDELHGHNLKFDDTLTVQGVVAEWFNVPTVNASVLKVGTIEGNINGTTSYTPTGITSVSSYDWDSLFGTGETLEKPTFEVGDRWSDISGKVPSAEDFLDDVEDYYDSVNSYWSNTVYNHIGSNTTSASSGTISNTSLSDFDKRMGEVVGGTIKDLPSTASYIRDYLMSFIGNENGVYGLMGNLYAESGLRSNNLENNFNNKLGITDEQYTDRINNGSNFIDNMGYGLAQWTRNDRKQGLLDTLGGRDVSDLNGQLEYLKKELTTTYSGVLNTLRNASSIEEASDAVLYQFEKPTKKDDNVADLRMAYGQDIANQLGSSNVKNIEDEKIPTDEGIKGFDEVNVVEKDNTSPISFLDNLPLATEYIMAQVYNVIDKWLGRIFKLFKSFTVDGFLEDLLKLNEIGDIFDSTILKKLRDVLEEIADLLRKLIEDGIKSVEDTRHLDLNTNAKSQNTRAVEALTDAIYDWIKCAGDTGHLDNNTQAKSKNTKAVEILNNTIGELANSLGNIKCECNCCCNCNGCGGNTTSGGGGGTTTITDDPTPTSSTGGGGYTPPSGHTTSGGGNTGGGGYTPTPTNPTGNTGGGGGYNPTPTNPSGGTSRGTDFMKWVKNGVTKPLYITLDGVRHLVTDTLPQAIKDRILRGEGTYDLDGTPLSRINDPNAKSKDFWLEKIRKWWDKSTKDVTNAIKKTDAYITQIKDGIERKVYGIIDGKRYELNDQLSDELKNMFANGVDKNGNPIKFETDDFELVGEELKQLKDYLSVVKGWKTSDILATKLLQETKDSMEKGMEQISNQMATNLADNGGNGGKSGTVDNPSEKGGKPTNTGGTGGTTGGGTGIGTGDGVGHSDSADYFKLKHKGKTYKLYVTIDGQRLLVTKNLPEELRKRIANGEGTFDLDGIPLSRFKGIKSSDGYDMGLDSSWRRKIKNLWGANGEVNPDSYNHEVTTTGGKDVYYDNNLLDADGGHLTNTGDGGHTTDHTNNGGNNDHNTNDGGNNNHTNDNGGNNGGGEDHSNDNGGSDDSGNNQTDNGNNQPQNNTSKGDIWVDDEGNWHYSSDALYNDRINTQRLNGAYGTKTYLDNSLLDDNTDMAVKWIDAQLTDLDSSLDDSYKGIGIHTSLGAQKYGVLDKWKSLRDEENKKVESYRNEAKQYFDNIMSKGDDSTKSQAQSRYDWLMTNHNASSAQNYKNQLDALKLYSLMADAYNDPQALENLAKSYYDEIMNSPYATKSQKDEAKTLFNNVKLRTSGEGKWGQPKDAAGFLMNLKDLRDAVTGEQGLNQTQKNARLGANGNAFNINDLAKSDAGKAILANALLSERDSEGNTIHWFLEGNGSANQASANAEITDSKVINELKDYIRSLGITEDMANFGSSNQKALEIYNSIRNNASISDKDKAKALSLFNSHLAWSGYGGDKDKRNSKMESLYDQLREISGVDVKGEKEAAEKEAKSQKVQEAIDAINAGANVSLGTASNWTTFSSESSPFSKDNFYTSTANAIEAQLNGEDVSKTLGRNPYTRVFAQTQDKKNTYEIFNGVDGISMSDVLDTLGAWYQRFQTKGYQMGGLPNAGEIFVARENGTPEFVGSFGNRTAVANNDQIVTAVANGVAMANDSLRNAIDNQTQALENAIDRKDLEVNIGDRQIAEANRRGERNLGQNFIS